MAGYPLRLLGELKQLINNICKQQCDKHNVCKYKT